MSKPTLLYVGHSYHRQTASTAFFIDLLRRQYELVVMWDESWLPGKPRLRAEQINALRPDIVVFFQLVPTRRVLRRIRCQHLFLVPMYDQVAHASARRWARIRGAGLRVISFCRATHVLFTELGFESLPVQYWPSRSLERPLDTGDGMRILFWARRHEIGWQLLKQLLGRQRPEQIVLRAAADPGELVDLPGASDISEYRIRLVTGWMPKAQYLELLGSCNLFMAPRLYEGIGQSFLEAMAMGIAVVAPDSPTMNEYIVHQRDGYLYDYGAPAPLELSAVSSVRASALAAVEDGHRRWLADEPRILDFLASSTARRPSLRWRLFGW